MASKKKRHKHVDKLPAETEKMIKLLFKEVMTGPAQFDIALQTMMMAAREILVKQPDVVLMATMAQVFQLLSDAVQVLRGNLSIGPEPEKKPEQQEPKFTGRLSFLN